MEGALCDVTSFSLVCDSDRGGVCVVGLVSTKAAVVVRIFHDD